MRFAHVRLPDGAIVNVVEADDDWATTQTTDEFAFVPDPDGEADIGGTYSEGVFTKPEVE